ncbi:MAG: fumarate hydratase [Candidatus Methanomethyliaceae archaeon]|nr:fumarate hydratase [Candidatus Methanomethyliaceae archaeon]MDW7970951.1 fumarate hydratase [Nitrososphaerota archaeon]
MNVEDIVEAIRALECDLPKDVENKLLLAKEKEEGLSRMIMEAILENVKYARENKIPICQDTGIIEFFVSCEEKFSEIRKMIIEGIKRATEEVPLRKNTVNPFTRENQGENLGRFHPILHFENSNEAKIDILAKGAGSENVSCLSMLDPTCGIEGIKKLVIQTVKNAGRRPCPPIVVGVGVGGTMEKAIYFAKRALLRELNSKNPDLNLRELEEELLKEINKLGIGPMGFGGKTTALGVLIEWGHCHTASLPVAVNIQCWALRRRTIILR